MASDIIHNVGFSYKNNIARFARKKGEKLFIFRALPEK
jgi:hypothetical protein